MELKPPFYEYGGMKEGQNTKSHICDDTGKPLCGVRSNWMEAGEPIDSKGFVKGMEHLFPISDYRHFPCSKCLRNWESYNNQP